MSSTHSTVQGEWCLFSIGITLASTLPLSAVHWAPGHREVHHSGVRYEESRRSELGREREDSLSFALSLAHCRLAEVTLLYQGPQVLSSYLGRGRVPLLHSRCLNIPVDSPAQSSENRSFTEPPVANFLNVSSISFWYPTWYIQALKTYYF